VIPALLVLGLAARILFPGPVEKFPSPDGRHMVLWEKPRPGDEEYTHRLRLGARGSPASRVVMEFFRHAMVEWSPSSRYFVVTCWCGSNFAAVTLFDIEDPGHPLDVGGELQRRVGHLVVLDNHHSYVEAMRWSEPSKLELRLWGYGEQNPEGFERRYAFPLTGEPALLSSHDDIPGHW
jgi:hypothetical protein